MIVVKKRLVCYFNDNCTMEDHDLQQRCLLIASQCTRDVGRLSMLMVVSMENFVCRASLTDFRREHDKRHCCFIARSGEMNAYIQISTTAASEEEANAIARLLVEKRLAACVQVIGPITSHYRWQGKIETAGEYLCLAKSTAALYPEIEEAIQATHSYEVPEIIAIPCLAGSKEYLAWLAEEVGKAF